jgi:four helix bundle protein
MIKDITELDVYQLSMSLLPAIYEVCKYAPYSEHDTVDQIKRSSKSIPANLAEGFAKRHSAKEFKRYLDIALGSSDETIVHLRILYISFPSQQVKIVEIANQYKILSKRINKLKTTWLTDKLVG